MLKKNMAEVPFLSSAAKHHYNFPAFISHNYHIFFNFDTVLFAQNHPAKVQNTSAETIGADDTCIHSAVTRKNHPYNQLLGD